MTCSKIVSKLAKQPYTYYQLRSASKIHGDILRRRLNLMTNSGEIIKFKYTMTPPNRVENPVVYKYDYYLLNWSKPECKQMLDFYNSYSLEGRMAKIREEEDNRVLMESKQKMNASINRRVDETEKEYHKRRAKIEKLDRKVKSTQDKLVRVWKKTDKDKEKATIECAKLIVQRGHSPLNLFIDLRVNGIFKLVNAVYTDIWDFMDKAELLKQYTVSKTNETYGY
jgi:Txe/YoeB family toxin of Txe-Axe toxin-antitoxin module